MVFPGEPYRQGVVGDGGLFFFPVFVLDNDSLVRTGKCGSQTRAILFYPFVYEVSVFLQTDDESLFLFQELIVELPPVSSPVNCIYALGANSGSHGIDHFEELIVLAFEVFRFLGICLQIQGNDLLVFDICGHRFREPIAIANFVFTPVMDLAKALHPGGMPLPYVSWIDGDDYVIEDFPASQPTYLAVNLFGEIPVVEISR